MRRDLSTLSGTRFDLVVVGGGVYGAIAAWDAALRGLAVALVERGDFGAETSFNSLKTIHGGLRYLQHGDLRRMRESIRERSVLLRIAPHLVHPLPFLVPTYRDVRASRAAFRLALLLNDLVGLDRNRGAKPGRRLPPGRILSREECLRLAPGLAPEGLTGGALWYDAQMRSAERLTLSFVLAAAEAGAVVANHLEATGFLGRGDRVEGIRARCRLSGDELDVRAAVVLNAAGPWVDELLGRLGRARRRVFAPSKAVNLVTRALVGAVAVGAPVPTARFVDDDALVSTGRRFLFLVPWRDATLVGTTHAAYEGGPDGLEVTAEDVDELVESARRAYPGVDLAREDVRLVHRGLLPAAPSRNGSVRLAKKYRLVDHREEGIEGLVTIVGVKYTTARDVAEKAVDLVFDQLGTRPPAARTATTPVPGGAVEDLDALVRDALARRPAGLDEASLRHLVTTYGSDYRRLVAYVEAEPALGRPLSSDTDVVGAEIVHAVREEMAVDLPSLVLRRTELGTAGPPDRAALEACAAIAARELGWSAERRARELGDVEAFFRSRSGA